MSAALYDGWGDLLHGDAGVGYEAAIRARPICHVLTDDSIEWLASSGGTVDLIWCLPDGPDPFPIPEEMLARLVVVTDAGGCVAVHATDAEAIAAAIDAVLTMTGGAA